jgi:ribosomal protein S18 acetylase RimI-like enzyme
MIEVVRAEEHHVPDIGRLWWEFIRFHGNIDSWFTPLEGSIPGFQEYLVERFMQSENGLVLVALDNGKVVGYSLSEVRAPSPGLKQEKWGYIDQMAITASYRGKGVGQKILVEIFAWLKSKGVNRVELEVTAQNAIGYAFWRKHGFQDYMHRLYLNMG